MFPVRCYTCNACLAQQYPEYRARAQRGENASDVLQGLGVRRLCCRRMFLGYVNLIDEQLPHPNKDVVLDEAGTILYRLARQVRVVSCD